MEPDRTTLTVLRPALEAARAVLRRRDKEEVPASLKDVAASSARTLPPPRARALFDALDEDADLRDAAAKEIGHGPEVTAARAFLTRPGGWEEIVDEAVAAAGGASAERDLERTRAELDRTTSRLEAERRKVVDLRRRIDDLDAQLGEAADARAAAVRSAVAASAEELAAASRSVERLEAGLAEVTDERDRLAERLELARADARDRRKRPNPVTGGPVARGWAGTPEALARHADDVFAAAKARIADPGGWRHDDEQPDGEVPFTLPPGVRPDSAEAVDAVASWSVHVHVDGYNLAGALGSLGDASSARTSVRDAVNRLRAVARGPISIVFDSAEGEGEKPGETYVADADAELRRLAREAPETTVVVSDDREVIEGVTEAGATALWSQALVEWLGR